MLCIGHRGAMGYAPENTLKSFKKALELGAPWVEADVFYVDDHLIVMHDERLERTTNGKGLLSEKSFTYLRSLDAGDGEKIPTLEELLDLLIGKAGINIELKGSGTAGPVIKLIRKKIDGAGEIDNFLISSFDHDIIAEVRSLDNRIKIGVLLNGFPETYPSIAEDLKAYSVNQKIDFVNREFVTDAHKMGLKVFVYTVNKPDDIIRMEAMGADGVFTNYPDRVLGLNP